MALRIVPPPVPQSEPNPRPAGIDRLPAASPAELGAELDAAARRVTELREHGREVRFSTGEGGGLLAQLLDLDGNVLRTLTASEALDIATGGPLQL